MRSSIRLVAVLALGVMGCGEASGASGGGGTAGGGGTGGSSESIELTVIVDNYAVDERLETAWGYACLVRGLPRPILFDTGPDGTMLLENMEALALDPTELDLVFLSHAHADHTGGLIPFLNAASAPRDVYLLESSPAALKDAAIAESATLHEVTGSQKVIENAHSLGQMGTEILEQALVIETEDGLIVVTGCAHPGIVNIVAAAQEAFGKNVLLVMGGFHLFLSTTEEIDEAVEALRALGVKYVAPSHCTGDAALEAFAEAFAERYLAVGGGATVAVRDLM